MNTGIGDTKTTLNLKGKILDMSEPRVMGVLNLTPDSFYDKSRIKGKSELIKKCQAMLDSGVTMIDLGGHSTRPGAVKVEEKEEITRVVPAIKVLTREFPDCILSIDTYRSAVAEAAVDEGAAMINDISGGQLDPQMFPLLARTKVPYVLGHMKGTFDTMMSQVEYGDLIGEVFDFFQGKINQLKELDVNDVIVDPGFGFSKTLEQNYELLKNLGYFINLGRPLLVGFSRKSMIYKLLGITPDDALNGTTALNTIGLMKGANIIRVHDVKEATEVVRLFNMVR